MFSNRAWAASVAQLAVATVCFSVWPPVPRNNGEKQELTIAISLSRPNAATPARPARVAGS